MKEICQQPFQAEVQSLSMRDNPIEDDRVLHMQEVFEDRELPEYLDYLMDRDRWLPFKRYRWIDKAIDNEFPDMSKIEKVGVLRKMLS